ncbi:hypothetical protein RRG08_024621 [Elysia crispata]|uniref:C-type lectin domain-containing protein n=1 Tax=Elysia crispata TaxID=231223 RepID=A0AAE0ZYA2_9GAST|nr:hypothetical protein RRG08_024621 [Elysia crispata]
MQLFILLCWVIVGSYSLKVVCKGKGWIENELSGTCVKAINRSVDWQSTRRPCRQLGASLLKIFNCYQNIFVAGLVNPADGPFWLGLRQLSILGDFTWVRVHKKAPYTNWAPGEPKNATLVSCGLINYPNVKRGQWVAKECINSFKFFCEKKADLVCDDRKFGVNCTQNCSVHCAGRRKLCDITSGVCLSMCEPGYQGAMCDTECRPGRYGSNCSLECSHCAGPNQACHIVSGTCLLGCADGYLGPKCDKKCNAGRYGKNCSRTCSPKCAGSHDACDEVNGECVLGCEHGYQGHLCDTVLYTIFGVSVKTVVIMCICFTLVWLYAACVMLTMLKLCHPEAGSFSSKKSSKSEAAPSDVSDKQFPLKQLEVRGKGKNTQTMPTTWTLRKKSKSSEATERSAGSLMSTKTDKSAASAKSTKTEKSAASTKPEKQDVTVYLTLQSLMLVAQRSLGNDPACGGFDYPSGNTNRLVELMMLDLAAAWAQGVNFPGSEMYPSSSSSYFNPSPNPSSRLEYQLWGSLEKA